MSLRSFRSRVRSISCLALAVLGSVASAQPANDICANATLITDSSSPQFIAYTTTGATYESAPAPCGCTSGPDVWFRYVAGFSGTVQVTTRTLATWDTSLVVYSGTCFSLTNVACNDDTVGSLQSTVSFSVIAGAAYYIRASGCGSGSGYIRFVGPSTVVSPTNEVTFQGQLKDASGQPIDGNVNLVYQLVNENTWTVLSTSVENATLSNGLVTRTLSAAIINSNDRLSVAVTVNGTRLLPNFPINRSLQARYADQAGNATTATTALGPWIASGSNLTYTAGTVAAGLNNPVAGVSFQASAGAGFAASAPDVVFGLTGSPQLRFDNNEMQAVDSTAASTPLFLNFAGGVVNIGGQVANNSGLNLNGNAFKPGGGSWSVLSDGRLKHDVEPMHDTLSKLLSLRGVTFEYNEPEKIGETAGTKLGMVAQEVEAVFPQWVSTNADGNKFITFTGFEALTVEALRDLRNEKDAAIKTLQSENEELRARLDRIEQLLAEKKKD
jgi:hypothetical protein